MKRLMAAVFALMLVVALSSPAAAGSASKSECFRKQDGSKQHPYVLCAADDLQLLHAHPSAHFVLGNSIDLQGTAWTSVSGFSGTLDGKLHAIVNLQAYFGLFEHIEEQGVVKNLRLQQVVIRGAMMNAGGLAGTNFGKIENVAVTGMIAAVYGAGGIVDNNYGRIANSLVSARISGTYHAGGIAGYNAASGIIERSLSDSTLSGAYHVGGIAGENSGIVREALFYGAVTVHASGGGGIVGTNYEDGQLIHALSYANVYYSPDSSGSYGKLYGSNSGTIVRSYGFGQLIPM